MALQYPHASRYRFSGAALERRQKRRSAICEVPNRPRGYWTEEKIWDEAVAQCQTYSEFVQMEKKAPYSAARYHARKSHNAKNGSLSACEADSCPCLLARIKRHFDHQKPLTENPEMVREIAARYRGQNARSRFHDECRAAYEAAKALGILEEILAPMGPAYTRWSYELVMETAANFDKFSDFQKNHAGAVQHARENGFLEEVKRLARPGLTRIPEAKVIERGCNFRNTGDFVREDPAAYQSAVKRGLLPRIFDLSMRRTRSEAWLEAEKASGPAEFYRCCRDAYKSAKEGGFLDEILAFLMPSHEEIYLAARTAGSRERFRVDFRRHADAAKFLGIDSDVNRVLAPPPRRPGWGDILSVARQCADYTHFHRNQARFYEAARAGGMLDELIETMGWSRQSYSDAELSVLFGRHKTRQDVRREDINAYRAARRRDIFPQLSAHMPKRTAVPDDCPTLIYRISRADEIYIGITNDPAKRFSAHRVSGQSHERVEYLAQTGDYHYLCRTALDAGEIVWRPFSRGRLPQSAYYERVDAIALEGELIEDLTTTHRLRNRAMNAQYCWTTGTWDYDQA